MNHGRPPPVHFHHRGQHGEQRGREGGHHGAPPPHQRGPEDKHPPPGPPSQAGPPRQYHSYKVLIDPMIHKGAEKMVRYDGLNVPGNPHSLPPSCSDPRKKPLPSLWRRLEDLELPVPRMTIDENYVGEPPKVEVTMDNLNDNIDKHFLANRLEKFGEWDMLRIDYHPASKKHLGLARIMFRTVKAAKECVTGLHGKSIMGKLVNCYLDPRFLMAKKIFLELTTDKKPSPEPEPEEEKVEEVEKTNNDVVDGYDERSRPDGRWGEREEAVEDERWEEDRRRSKHHHEDDEYDRGHRGERGSRWEREDRWSRREGRRHTRQEHRIVTPGTRWDREDGRDSRDRREREREEWKQPGFSWEEAAAKYAATAVTEEKESVVPQPVEEQQVPEKTVDNRTIDLDTRLQMLMKSKSANMPAFLIGSESSEEEGETGGAGQEEAAAQDHEAPLSRAPSPFLSHEIYLSCHQATLQHDQMEKVNSALATVSVTRPGSRLSDKMSLSPLSEGGELSELHQTQLQFPGPGYMYPGTWGTWPGYQDQAQYQYQQYQYQDYSHYTQYTEEQARTERANKKFEGRNPLTVIIDNVLKIVETELKQILKKDINKRICETYAFLLFDNWWTEQEVKYKEKQEREAARLRRSEPAPAIVPPDKEKVADLPRIPKPEDLTSLIDKRRANLDSNKDARGGGGSLGLGFRGTIPKLATIQRKPRSPSPGARDKQRSKGGEKGKVKERSPKKKERDKEKERERERPREKEREKSPVKENNKPKSVYRDIYGESDSGDDHDEEDSESSSDVVSSEESESQSSESGESDSEESDEDSGSKSTSKSGSRSRSQSKSRSRSRSKSESRSITEVKAVRSPTKSSVSPRRSALAKTVSSETDSAEEVQHLEAVEEVESQEDKTDPGTPVKVTHVMKSPPHITDHCYARPSILLSSSSDEVVEVASMPGGGDHDYTRPRTPPAHAQEPLKHRVKKPVVRPKLPVKQVKWKPREYADKFQIIYKFLTNGLDAEDIMYIKNAYEMMLNEGLSQPNLAWINDTHWVDHPITNIPDPPAKKRRLDDFSRPHKTGSARTEGFYKMDPREKARTKYHFHRSGVDAFNIAKLGTKEQQKPQKAISLSREARSEQRRMLNALGEDYNDSNLLQFNTLKFRRKAMRFGKSSIHDWGLFAMEHIGADEMVIEYVGDVIRPVLADDRERRYEKQGIGSSYLFRIDLDYVVDATKCGNLARFVNHSCEPNCYAKVIKIDGVSKIVIYSKQTIAIGEEITYDYKFPIEDEKIRCLCGSKGCRKYLN